MLEEVADFAATMNDFIAEARAKKEWGQKR